MSKWLYYSERVAKIKQRKYYEVMPVTAQIAPTLYCNFQCPRCSYGRSKNQIASLQQERLMEMNYDIMCLIIDRLVNAGIKGLLFTGGGEPIKNSFVIDGMYYARKRGLKIGLFTNGSLLTYETINRIQKLNPTFIRINLDAGTPEIHSLVHGYRSSHNIFKKVIENIEIMTKMKDKHRSNTTIGIGYTIEPVNLNDIINVAYELKKITEKNPKGRIDYLVFRPVVNYHMGGYKQKGKYILEFLEKNLPEYYKSYSDYINKGYQYPQKLFISANKIINEQVKKILGNSGIHIIDLRSKMSGVTNKDRPYTKCRACPWYIFIGPDGSVYNCVELGLDSRVTIGNLISQSLEDIWQNDRRKEVLNFINEDGIKNLCPPVCLYYEMNILFEKLDNDLKINSINSKALKWIKEQEKKIFIEKSMNCISQQHIEFI
jgi:radical SAM protein with 4Fe4S-binding SPASM domain